MATYIYIYIYIYMHTTCVHMYHTYMYVHTCVHMKLHMCGTCGTCGTCTCVYFICVHTCVQCVHNVPSAMAHM